MGVYASKDGGGAALFSPRPVTRCRTEVLAADALPWFNIGRPPRVGGPVGEGTDMGNKAIKVGILGLGNIGAGTVEILK